MAEYACDVLAQDPRDAQAMDDLIQWCTHALVTPEAQVAVAEWVSFRVPARFMADALIPLEQHGHIQSVPDAALTRRDGFDCTDKGASTRFVHDQLHYCVLCHKKSGDFCRTGFPEKKGEPILGYKKNDLQNDLLGCPLEQKISEMHQLKRGGHTIASLVMLMMDNPMCARTGHRICNDCMKACIYQKQDPVDIPQIETRILKDVLALPWGVEIYDLFTRWNPLLPQAFCSAPYNGRNVLVMGMGPAGITMAHYLLQAGCAVVGMDGLKIEALD